MISAPEALWRPQAASRGHPAVMATTVPCLEQVQGPRLSLKSDLAEGAGPWGCGQEGAPALQTLLSPRKITSPLTAEFISVIAGLFKTMKQAWQLTQPALHRDGLAAAVHTSALGDGVPWKGALLAWFSWSVSSRRVGPGCTAPPPPQWILSRCLFHRWVNFPFSTPFHPDNNRGA